MIIRPLFPLIAVVLLSCALQRIDAAQTPEFREGAGVVSGTVAHKERVALPADAVVDVWITDVSPLIVVTSVVAETTVASNGRQVPLSFELRYDPSRIVADHIYSVKAAIRSAGEILFASETDTLVITKGNPTHVNLSLVRPGGGGGSANSSGSLPGTSWRLEDLGGAGVLDRIEATLEFSSTGRVVGNGSCNRFGGTVDIAGQSIKFGPLTSTRMACLEAVGMQESRYLKALQEAEHFSLNGTVLLIHCKGIEHPLRFIRREPSR